MVIRTAENSDVRALSLLAIETYCDAFGHTFSSADLTAHLEKNLSPECFLRILNDDTVLVAAEEDRLVGYVQFGAVKPIVTETQGGDHELRRLYVHHSHQNQEIGTRLMEAALGHPRMKNAENIYLDVWEHNHGAQRFYRRYGFEVIGTRSFDVESGAETSLDLIMIRRSSPQGRLDGMNGRNQR